jgi:nucleotide-binding universal stress UspA family protein
MPVERILVPVDFSEPSGKALEHAIVLAKTFGAKIDLIHVYRVPVAVSGPYAEPLPTGYNEGIRKAARVELDKWLERVTSAGVTANAHLVEGAPSHEIVQAAGRLQADQIVIGTRGLTGIKHLMLGSVADRTVRLAPCPVTTVPGDGD